MHDLLEGVVPQIIKLVLREFIKTKKYLDCDTFNNRLRNFDYGPVESQDKPCANVSLQKLSEKGNKIKQTAAQTWVLLRVFPFIVNGLIPEEETLNDMIVILQKICYVCFSNVATNEMIDGLEFNISVLHNKFKECFAEITPINKMHHLSHYANNAKATSIPNDFSCMRFEALNKLPKNQMRNAQNFKNVPLSLAKRLNLKQVSAIMNRNYCQRVEIISDSIVKKDSMPHVTLLQQFPSNLHYIKHVKIDGIHFRTGAVIKYEDDNNSRQYAMLQSIYYIENKFYFVSDHLTTIGFSERFNSFHVLSSSNQILLPEERVYKRKTYSIWIPYSSDDCYVALQYYDNFK